MPESVDAAKRSLYKGGHGGGRKSRRRCSLSDAGEELICGLHICVQHFARATAISETSETTSSVDHVTKRSARAFAIESERSPR
jgi:hypothetical protein